MDAVVPLSREEFAGNVDVRAYVAVLFSDICSSTTIAAQVDADTYGDLLETIRNTVAPIVSAFDGTVAQVYGDGILSVFRGTGAAARAVEAATRLHAATSAIRPPRGASVRHMRMHSGIHYGLALVRPGDRVRGTVEIVGRTTAVAQRLSAAALPGEILISQGSIGPRRHDIASGPARLIDIGDGTEPVAAIPIVSAEAALPATQKRIPFVGRDSLLAQFTSMIDGLNSGHAQRLVVTAAAGMGKSRLSRQIEQTGLRQGVATFSGTCSVSADLAPMQAFRQILDAMRPDRPVDACNNQSVVACVAETLANGPLLLLFDDWQWADSATRALVVALSELPGTLGLFLLTRDRDAPDIALPDFTELRIPPLTADETTQLVRFLRPEFDPLDAARIHVRAGGNPLYVEELCLLDARTARTLLPDAAEPRGVGWLASLTSARMQQLSEDVRTALEVAAVAGMQPRQWLLEKLLGDRAATAIPVLLERDFLLRTGPESALAFRHGVSWEIVYSLIPLARRRQHHAEIAKLLHAQSDCGDASFHETLAWHFFASDQPEKCLPHAEAAGDHALAIGSLDAARAQYRMALEAFGASHPQAVDLLPLRRIVGKLGYVCIYDTDSAQIPLFEQAATWAAQREDKAAEAEAEYWLGFICHGAGDSKRAIRHCTRALALWQGPPTSPFPVQVRATLGESLVMTGRYAEATPLLEEALALKQKHLTGQRASPGTAYALALRAGLLADTGNFPGACAMIEEAEALTNGEPHPVVGSVLAWRSAIHAWRGDWQELAHTAARGCDIARRVEAVYIHAVCRSFESYARWRLGGGDDAADDLKAAVDCMAGRGKALALSIPLGFLAEVHAARGEHAACRHAVAGAVGRARIGEPIGLAAAARSWATSLAPTAPGRARIWLERARANARQRCSPHEAARCDLAEARLGLASPQRRGELIEKAAGAFAKMGMTTMLAEAEALR